MSTDFQQARVALGARLRELRTEAGLTVRQLATQCGWAPSKVSKLENGRQTATLGDLDSWARETSQPTNADELKGRLRGQFGVMSSDDAAQLVSHLRGRQPREYVADRTVKVEEHRIATYERGGEVVARHQD